jgi:hypothetical protein
LKQAYQLAREASKQSRQANKRLYDRHAKRRTFKPGDLVYLFCPVRKPGTSRKFPFPWKGPFEILAKLSDLNYEIAGYNNKKMVVYVNRLKAVHGTAGKQLIPPAQRPQARKPRAVSRTSDSDGMVDAIDIPSRPLVAARELPPVHPTDLPQSPLPPYQLFLQHVANS